MKDWYRQYLGIDAGEHGFIFRWNEDPDKPSNGSTVWTPFAETTKYFEPSFKDFMINYRVDNLEALVGQLQADGISMLDKIETYPPPYGKFVHLLDPEGNKIELWEPTE